MTWKCQYDDVFCELDDAGYFDFPNLDVEYSNCLALYIKNNVLQ